MIFQILGLSISFTIQTVFLTLALWIMILIQKLDYNFPGLLGSAALSCFVDIVIKLALTPWFGPFAAYMSAPIFFGVLYLCVQKVTSADVVDVCFTIVVGGALRFGMNLWLIGFMMGDLRPHMGSSNEYDKSAPQIETNEVQQVTAKPGPSAAPAKAGKSTATGTNLFTVKGVSRNGARSAVTIQTGTRTYTIFLGEAVLTQTSKGPISVRFKELGDSTVVLIINGTETTLRFR